MYDVLYFYPFVVYLIFFVFRIQRFFMIEWLRRSGVLSLGRQLLDPLLFQLGRVPLLQIGQRKTGQNFFLNESIITLDFGRAHL